MCHRRTLWILLLLAYAAVGAAQPCDPLPSWNEGSAKTAIVTFVAQIVDPDSDDFVPPPERIVTFDNDGTLWCEQPLPVELYFAIDRVRELAPQNPDWKTQEPFAAILRGDTNAALAGGERALLQLVLATHAGMTAPQFDRIVTDWIATARHPRFRQPFTACVYVPMLELLAYLHNNDFKVFIVSGGGIEFMRPWTPRVYAVPPERVVGSSVKTQFVLRDGKPTLVRLPEVNFVDDKAGKPVGIYQHIGRQPIAAFGNSDGDQQMLEYTQAGAGRRLMLLVLHDDAKREYAYGPAQGLPKPLMGAFTPELYQQATQSGWVVVSMKNDWKRVFAFE